MVVGGGGRYDARKVRYMYKERDWMLFGARATSVEASTGVLNRSVCESVDY